MSSHSFDKNLIEPIKRADPEESKIASMIVQDLLL